MDDEQEQFTRRMLRRAGLKKENSDDVSNFNSMRRKLNILRAIDVNNTSSEQIIDPVDEKRKGRNLKKEGKINARKSLLNINNNELKKNNCPTSTSWSKIPSNYIETLNTSTLNNSHELAKNLTIDEFYQKNQFLEQKDENSFNSEKFLKFDKENLSDSSKNNSLLNETKNMETNEHEWEDTVKKCINNYFENLNKKCKNIDTKLEEIKNDVASPKNFLSPKSNFLHKMIASSEEFLPLKNETKNPLSPLSTKTEFFSPRSEFPSLKQEKTEYFSPENFQRKIDISDQTFETNVETSELQKKENSINELSLSTFVKGLDTEENEYLEKTDETWKDASDFFKSTDNKEESQELLKVTCKIIEEDNLDVKLSTLPAAESISKNLEKLHETQSENESLDLSLIIDNLDEEIKNLEIRPEALQIESMSDTPKIFSPIKISSKSQSCTPRKLFHQENNDSKEKQIQESEKSILETEELEKNQEPKEEKEKQKVESGKNESTDELNESKEKIFKSPMTRKSSKPKKNSTSTSAENSNSFLRRNSSFFRFKTPISWKAKPNLESTRKSSNYDLTKSKITNSPSNVDSMISSINPNSPASQDENERKSQRISDCSISFEVEKFLEEALGEELYSTSMTYGLDKTNSNLDATELMSGDRTSLQSWALNSSQSENRRFSRHSTLNRTISAYKSLSKRIKTKFRPSLKETMKQVWNPILPLNSELNEKLQPLIQEVNIQQTRIYQASKALDYCRSIKMFQASPEQVESERLLLIAQLKKQALFNEIKAITSGTKLETTFTQQANIIVDNFSLTLKDSFLQVERQKDIVEWFVIVVTHGLTVWSTQAVTCPTDGTTKIPFTGSITIPNLNPDFKILVRVFSTKYHNIWNVDKFYTKDMDRDTTCPSPTKLLKRSERPVSMRSHDIKFSGIRETSFTLQGYVELQVHDLSLYPPWPLMSMPRNSVLHNSIDLQVTSKLDVDVYHAGFLNYGNEMGGYAAWNRRWCVLEKHMLMFWNYPREQEVKPPILTINLMESLSDHVTTISRTLCARPRTFVIEISRQRNKDDRNSGVMECRASCTIIKHLLQCDSLHDLMEWKTKLNHILTVFREWNVKGDSYPVASALYK